jgi:hypothetical protein
MDRSEPPSPEDQLSIDCFFVGRNSRGQWVVQDADHRRGGLFVNCAAALKFARDEDSHGRHAVVMVADVLELDMNAPALAATAQTPLSSYRRAA